VDQVNSTCSGGQGAAHSYTGPGRGRPQACAAALFGSERGNVAGVSHTRTGRSAGRAARAKAMGMRIRDLGPQAEAEVKAVATSSEAARSYHGSQ